MALDRFLAFGSPSLITVFCCNNEPKLASVRILKVARLRPQQESISESSKNCLTSQKESIDLNKRASVRVVNIVWLLKKRASVRIVLKIVWLLDKERTTVSFVEHIWEHMHAWRIKVRASKTEGRANLGHRRSRSIYLPQMTMNKEETVTVATQLRWSAILCFALPVEYQEQPIYYTRARAGKMMWCRSQDPRRRRRLPNGN